MFTSALTLDEAKRVLADTGCPAICTLEQAQAATGLSKSTLRRRTSSGELRRLKSREARGGRLLILRDDLAQMLVAMSGGTVVR